MALFVFLLTCLTLTIVLLRQKGSLKALQVLDCPLRTQTLQKQLHHKPFDRFCPAVHGRQLNLFFLYPCPNPEFDKISVTAVLVRNNEATALEGTSNLSESPRRGSPDASVRAWLLFRMEVDDSKMINSHTEFFSGFSLGNYTCLGYQIYECSRRDRGMHSLKTCSGGVLMSYG